MKYCTNCGKKIKGNLKFCNYCGYKFASVKPTKTEKMSKSKSSPMKNIGLTSAIIVSIIVIIFFIAFQTQTQKQYEQQLKNSEMEKLQQEEQNRYLQEQREIEQANAMASEYDKQVQLDQARRDKEASEALAQLEIQRQVAEKREAEEALNKKKIQDTLLGQDLDGDGLTLREEQDLGTDPENIDSDNDGIPDGSDTNPAGGGRNLNAHVAGFELIVHSDYFDYYKNMERSSSFSQYVHHNEEYIQELISHLNSKASSKGTTIIDEIITFVHDLDYVYDHTLGFDQYSKYPVETLVEGTGDCEDTSILMASLLKGAGYGVVLLSPPGHMAVGVRCSYDYGYVTYNEVKYCYIETTSHHDWQVGEIPSSYEGESFEIYSVS